MLVKLIEIVFYLKGDFMKVGFLFLFTLFFSTVVSSKTIEVKDPKVSLEILALYGAASICSESKNMTTSEQSIEMLKIKVYYMNVMMSNSVRYNYNLSRDASSEMFGIARNSNPNYKKCESALKVN